MNNSILGGRSAMPLKATTSLNENNFSMNRVLFAKTINAVEAQTADTLKAKQFFGDRNRDASSVIHRRKILNAGEKNSSGENMSHQGAKTTNMAKQAQQRVRSSGSVPPKKSNN